MTVAEIRDRVATIDRMKGDDEAAHCFEDDLYYDFVDYVASRSASELETRVPELIEMAQELRKVRDIDFERWCV